MTGHFFRCPNLLPECSSAAGRHEAGTVIGDDSDESQHTTPTPLAKTALSLHSVQDHTTPFEVDRQWTALESNEALQKIINRIYAAEGNIEGSFDRLLEHQRPAMATAGAAAVNQTLPQSLRS